MLPVITTDKFFTNPDGWRELALITEEWTQDSKGMWPGTRTRTLSELYPNKIFELTRALEDILPYYVIAQTGGIGYLEARFQSIPGAWGSGWIHEDKIENIDFAGVVYLDPNQQEDSGTSIYEFLGHSTDVIYANAFTRHKSLVYGDTSRHKEIEYIKKMREPYFKRSAKIENVYNRCTVYDAKYWHAADKYYGKTLEDSRLTLVFFGQFRRT
jgi:hypothetical protein